MESSNLQIPAYRHRETVDVELFLDFFGNKQIRTNNTNNSLNNYNQPTNQ